ncbi:CBS domain-containing protein [Amycolatopsis sp. FDAARGOS 1241]|uniref:CBS domain-containing protein n=1 Tax=Amycolatopsis sp. FDAARGOS 1241 TaxID=2778070 RepID=UPI001951CDD4|nr:CBS domain-containing protein [Amycolatopsis sp. FDAARGOS 1241]QRP50222.1 CBS domain-containing protein [Amycolatopsis sp. FDAARGOS 1241]
MRAREIMTRPVVRVGLATPVREAIALLTEHCIAALPVVDEDNRVIGLFTEADALAGVLTGEPVGPDQLVESTMTKPVEVAGLDTDVSDIAARMLVDRLRSIPVVDDGRLAGIVSRRDLLRSLVRHDDTIASQVRCLFSDYTGHRDLWSVSVTGGRVTVRGTFTDEAERRLVTALAKTVGGVTEVELA